MAWLLGLFHLRTVTSRQVEDRQRDQATDRRRAHAISHNQACCFETYLFQSGRKSPSGVLEQKPH